MAASIERPVEPPRDERGASATEYGLLVIFIAIALTVGVGLFGAGVNGMFEGFVADLAGIL